RMVGDKATATRRRATGAPAERGQPAEARLRRPDRPVAAARAPGRCARLPERRSAPEAGAVQPGRGVRPARATSRRRGEPPQGALDPAHVPAVGRDVLRTVTSRRWLALALLVPLYLWRLDRPAFSDTEGMFAEPARGMLVSGDWVTPRINDEPFFTKPPLM